MMLPIHQKKIKLILYFECWKKTEERKVKERKKMYMCCVTYYTKNIGYIRIFHRHDSVVGVVLEILIEKNRKEKASTSFRVRIWERKNLGLVFLPNQPLNLMQAR